MSLTAEQLEHFGREGYVVAEDVLVPDEDLQPLIDEYDEILDGVAQRLQVAGEIRSTYAELPFGERAIAVAKDAGFLDPRAFDISFPANSALTEETQFHFGPAVFGLLRNARLLDAVESIIGSEIMSNPVQHVRMKVPEHLISVDHRTSLNAKTGWHQDNGVVQTEADDTDLLTVWLALTEASERNGCLMVVPRSHVEGLRVHCNDAHQSQIPTELVPKERMRPLPMSPGDVLFMHRRCMHASLANVSDAVRWSLDIRYHPTGQPSGRDFFPSFVARSRADPDSELRDPVAWRQSWLGVRDILLAKREPLGAARWTGDHELCA
jgi:phytanoyl-CoA hydroxylase